MLEEDPQAPDEATPDTPTQEVAPEQDTATEPAYFDEKFDRSKLPPELQSAYNEMHGALTRKTQEISAQRQEDESLKSWWTALQDPQTQADALRQLGLEIQEDEGDEPDLDPIAQANERLAQLEQAEQQRELRAQADELEQTLVTDLEAADTGGRKLNDTAKSWILDRVIQFMANGQDVPVQQVVDEYRQIAQHELDGYVESKKAPRTPSPGQAGSQLPDNTEQGRVAQLAAAIAAEQG